MKLINVIFLYIGFLPIVMVMSQETFEKQLLNTMMDKILLKEYNNVATKDGYKFNYETTDGSVREEVGVIMNPGTDKEELVVMGAYGYDDGNIRTVTMYTADKNGYRPRVMLKSRKLNPKLLASLAG